MEFSEANSPWRDVPDWVSFMTEFGYVWMEPTRTVRRIAIVSMPSDSAAAGLIALGVMRKCMEFDDANDVARHYERLLELARSRSPDVVLRHTKRQGRFVFDNIDADGQPWVRSLNPRDFRKFSVARESALDWRLDGEAPVAIAEGQRVPNAEFYSRLVTQGGEIKASNFASSHSNVCLAGRVTGQAPTKGSMAEIRFRENGCETDLSQLLTVQSWMPGTISRVLFYNARTDSFDRDYGRPQVAVADGDTSFLKVLSRSNFNDCDVIGVIHRTMDRDKLEAVGAKIASLRQWYGSDESILSKLPATPLGVAVHILRRRT